MVDCFFLTKSSDEAFKEGQRRQIPIGVLYAPEDLLDDEHLKDRGFFTTVEGEEGPITYPGAPYVFSGFGTVRRRPPRLGEHQPHVMTDAPVLS